MGDDEGLLASVYTSRETGKAQGPLRVKPSEGKGSCDPFLVVFIL